MHNQLFERQWQRLRGPLKTTWPKLTDPDLDQVAGNFDQFLGLLQTHYGYPRAYAEEKFYRRMATLRELAVQLEFERRLAKFVARATRRRLALRGASVKPALLKGLQKTL